MSVRPEPRCAAHPERTARAACSRCGDFACEACFNEPDCDLCPPCKQAERHHPSDNGLPAAHRHFRRWVRRRSRLVGIAIAGVATGLAAFELVLIQWLPGHLRYAIPLAGAIMGMGLAVLAAPQPLRPPTLWRLTLPAVGLGLFAGLAVGRLL